MSSFPKCLSSKSYNLPSVLWLKRFLLDRRRLPAILWPLGKAALALHYWQFSVKIFWVLHCFFFVAWWLLLPRDKQQLLRGWVQNALSTEKTQLENIFENHQIHSFMIIFIDYCTRKMEQIKKYTINKRSTIPSIMLKLWQKFGTSFSKSFNEN